MLDAAAGARRSADGAWLLAGGKDLTVRLFSLHPTEGFEPPTLAGHRDRVVGVFFGDASATRAYTVSRDGALFVWECPAAAVPAGTGGEAEAGAARSKWTLKEKHFYMQAGAKLACCDCAPGGALLVAGFSTGVFALHALPDFTPLHLLSISSQPVTSAAFGADGAWLALGCAKLGQLLACPPHPPPFSRARRNCPHGRLPLCVPVAVLPSQKLRMPAAPDPDACPDHDPMPARTCRFGSGDRRPTC